MSLFKLVNGIEVEMSPEEEAATLAEREAAAALVIVPQTVTMRQARLALLNAGLLATVNSTVAAMEGEAGDAARIEWDYSSEVHRNRPLVLSLGQALGLDAAALDALFIAAAAL